MRSHPHTGRFWRKALANGNGAAKRPGNNGAADGDGPTAERAPRKPHPTSRSLNADVAKRRVAFTFLRFTFHRDALRVSRGNFQQTPENPPANPTRQVRKFRTLERPVTKRKAALDKNNFEAGHRRLAEIFLLKKARIGVAHFQLHYAYTGLNRATKLAPRIRARAAWSRRWRRLKLNLGFCCWRKMQLR